MTLLHVLSAEQLKLRRTLALWMVLIAPAVVLLLTFLTVHQRAQYFGRGKEDPWYLLVRSIFILWGFVMLPLFVTLESALLGGLEHNERQWHNLLAMPVPRWTIFVAKLLVLAGMVIAAHAMLLSGTIGMGLLLGVLKPSLRLAWPVSWRPLIETTLWTMAGTPFLIAAHHWVSLRWRSFTTAIGFGICAVSAGFIVSQSNTFWRFYPWSWPVRAGLDHTSPVVLIGAAVALFAAICACVDLSRREVL
jgi:ABC-2 type transport system permease protein